MGIGMSRKLMSNKCGLENVRWAEDQEEIAR
jgi:hypothetical protein